MFANGGAQFARHKHVAMLWTGTVGTCTSSAMKATARNRRSLVPSVPLAAINSSTFKSSAGSRIAVPSCDVMRLRQASRAISSFTGSLARRDWFKRPIFRHLPLRSLHTVGDESRKWTLDEDLLLKRSIEAGKTYGETADILHRPVTTIHYRLRVLRKERPDFMRPAIPKTTFTPEEDRRLLEYHRTQPSWRNIEHHFPGRSRAFLIHRHYRLVSGDWIKSTARRDWDVAEDAKLLDLAQGQGQTFKQMCVEFPGRSANALRSRYARLMSDDQRGPRPKAWNEADRKVLCDHVRSGKSIKRIAKSLGRSVPSIYSQINRIPEQAITDTSEEERTLAKRIRTLHRSGKTPSQIARKLGIRLSSTVMHTKPRLHYKRWAADELDTLRKLLDSGCSRQEIAHRLSRSVSSINKQILTLTPKQSRAEPHSL